MKKILLFLFGTICISSSYAELRFVTISCKAEYIGEANDVRRLTGIKYSLYTGVEAEEVENVDLKDLAPKIKEVAWADSAIEVAIFSDYDLDIPTLKSVLSAIETNPNMRIEYIENGNNGARMKRFKHQEKDNTSNQGMDLTR